MDRRALLIKHTPPDFRQGPKRGNRKRVIAVCYGVPATQMNVSYVPEHSGDVMTVLDSVRSDLGMNKSEAIRWCVAWAHAFSPIAPADGFADALPLLADYLHTTKSGAAVASILAYKEWTDAQ